MYNITKEFRIHHEDGWFYKFTDDGEGCIEIEYYEVIGGSEFAKRFETKQGSSFSIPKNCIETFIRVLGQME
jgi:hypothetical protein